MNKPSRITLALLGGAALAGTINSAEAVPLYARQTGQACVTCHLGGMYPQLTSYGRLFKLTGYTMGNRPNLNELDVTKDAPPISIWFQSARQYYTQNSNASQPTNTLNIQAVSLFSGGKITDNVGGFLQWTGANSGGGFNSSIDNSEVRYADRVMSPTGDLIYGLYLNNHPTVSDVWNDTLNWSGNFMGFFNGGPAQAPTPFINSYNPGSSVGVGAYLYKDNTWYGELGVYKTMTHGVATTYFTAGNASLGTLIDPSPYYRFAYTKEMGPHSLELGLHGMISYVHNPVTAGGSPDWGGTVSTYRDSAIDAQYQYNLNPHYFAAHARLLHESGNFASDQVGATVSNSSDGLNETYLDVSYAYQAKYGAMLIYHAATGSNDPTRYGLNTLTGSPTWTSWTPEIFWTPWQNVRLGYQYIIYTQMAGATGAIPGQTTKPQDYNTSMFYISFIY